MTIKKILTVLLVLCLTVGIAPAPWLTAYAETWTEEPLTDLSYIDDENEDHKLDLFADPEADSPKPVILEIHGGGFFGGTKESLTAHARVFADTGFAVAMPNYTHMPTANFKTIVQEIFTFLHWIEENAENYMLDLNHVFMSGDSAGGYLVLLTASVLGSPELQKYYEVEQPSYTVSGYALTCPVTDLPALADAYDGASGFVSFMAGQMGEAVLKDEDSFNHADLFQLIDPETFPEVYFLTTPTDTNFYSHSVKFDEFLTEKGIEHICVEYVGTEKDLLHTFNVMNPEEEDSQLANREMIEYLLEKMN